MDGPLLESDDFDSDTENDTEEEFDEYLSDDDEQDVDDDEDDGVSFVEQNEEVHGDGVTNVPAVLSAESSFD